MTDFNSLEFNIENTVKIINLAISTIENRTLTRHMCLALSWAYEDLNIPILKSSSYIGYGVKDFVLAKIITCKIDHFLTLNSFIDSFLEENGIDTFDMDYSSKNCFLKDNVRGETYFDSLSNLRISILKELIFEIENKCISSSRIDLSKYIAF